MKTVQLYGEYLKPFMDLDPFEQSEVLTLKGSFALGTTVEREDGKDMPAGLLIACEEEDRLVIRWIYVKPEYRGQGIGSHLMECVFDEAIVRGLPEVSARISERFSDSGLYWDTDSFFVNDVFKEYEDGFPELWLHARNISKLVVSDEEINEKAAGDRMIFPLSKLPAHVKTAMIKDMDKKYGMSLSVSADTVVSAADPDMSFVKIDREDGFLGGIFIRKVGLTWFVYLLVAKEKADREQLARVAMYYSEDYVKPNERICIIPTKEENIKLADSLMIPFVDSGIHDITAFTEDYIELKNLAFSELS